MKTRALLFSASLLVGGFLVPLGSSSRRLTPVPLRLRTTAL